MSRNRTSAGMKRLDVNLKQMSAKARLSMRGVSFCQQSAILDKTNLSASLGLVHIMRCKQKSFSLVAQVVKQFQICCRWTGSSPRVGSSRNRTEGSCTKAQPIAKQLAHSTRQIVSSSAPFFFQINYVKQAVDSLLQLRRCAH
jgi:hypothetical protein